MTPNQHRKRVQLAAQRRDEETRRFGTISSSSIQVVQFHLIGLDSPVFMASAYVI